MVTGYCTGLVGSERQQDDGGVSGESQLTESAQRNATAVYGVADNPMIRAVLLYSTLVGRRALLVVPAVDAR